MHVTFQEAVALRQLVAFVFCLGAQDHALVSKARQRLEDRGYPLGVGRVNTS